MNFDATNFYNLLIAHEIPPKNAENYYINA